ncbi:hypothetical protein [Aureliella helgolandensis]|uniref:Uncharacterized protein n=1 Tax=Aureliella helgolandensis TaxID=2527968 RepID=A0A518G8H4_9BACT|nr:hypothetical protein [Aureliella helgolandensis]QDV24883.1 hypothetical protein Q31a_32050 [Aureliella helgolandensis]
MSKQRMRGRSTYAAQIRYRATTPATVRSMVRSRWLLMGIVVLGLACTPQAIPASDVGEARAILTTVLDAWQAGKIAADLREQSPPVYVAEESWENGTPLLSYELLDQGALHGTNVRFAVTLRTKTAKKAARQLKAFYLVTTRPALTVARADR